MPASNTGLRTCLHRFLSSSTTNHLVFLAVSTSKLMEMQTIFLGPINSFELDTSEEESKNVGRQAGMVMVAMVRGREDAVDLFDFLR